LSRRIFARVRRGPMDNTAVCVFPWEMPLLEHLHMNNVEEVSIDQMANLKDGVIKIERIKLKHAPKHPAPDLRQQLEAMTYVDPEDDPALDPSAEYGRLADKYGMDKDFPIPVVERIFGQYQGDTCPFALKMKEHAKERASVPAHLRADGEGGEQPLAGMSREELRAACRERDIPFKATESKEALIAKLEPVPA